MSRHLYNFLPITTFSPLVLFITRLEDGIRTSHVLIDNWNSFEMYDLVTLMHVAIGMQHHHTKRKADICIEDVIGKIISCNDARERRFPVLDALANICVSQPKGQVVAVSLQLQLSEKKIWITLAENGEVKPDMCHKS